MAQSARNAVGATVRRPIPFGMAMTVDKRIATAHITAVPPMAERRGGWIRFAAEVMGDVEDSDVMDKMSILYLRAA